ncbi:hypothetical protein D3C74_135420 [compost metagenome]
MEKIVFSQITYAYEFTNIEIFFKYKNMTFLVLITLQAFIQTMVLLKQESSN